METEVSNPLAVVAFQTTDAIQQVEIVAGIPVFIVGRNGTGKSALVHHFAQLKGTHLVYLPGSRPSYFDNERLNLTPAGREQLEGNFRSWDSSPDTRWRSISGTARNERAIHDLQAAEIDFQLAALERIKREGAESSAIAIIQAGISPLDRVNALLAQGNLPVQVTVVKAELIAIRSGELYSIARMSDGERAALILAAEVVAAPLRSIFLIDEPESHLHQSIVVPLLAALINERPDCGFVVSTHEVGLPTVVPQSITILLREGHWQGGAIRSWDTDILVGSCEIPEGLLVDILGSRRKILFVEGKSTSLDQPLYALLFPNVSVRSRNGCREVRNAVTGLRAANALHRINAYGLVDDDAMDAAKIQNLETEGVYATAVYAVESLYYSAEALGAVAAVQAATLGIRAVDLLNEAKSAAILSLKLQGVAERLASRRAERVLREQLVQALPKRTELIVDGESAITVSVLSPYPAELQTLRDFVNASDLERIIARYPIRETGALSALASSLRFASRQDYEKAALTRIGADEALKSVLRSKLGSLAGQLL